MMLGTTNIKYMVCNSQMYLKDILNKSKVFAKEKTSFMFKRYKYVAIYMALSLVYLTTSISIGYKASNGDFLLK